MEGKNELNPASYRNRERVMSRVKVFFTFSLLLFLVSAWVSDSESWLKRRFTILGIVAILGFFILTMTMTVIAAKLSNLTSHSAI